MSEYRLINYFDVWGNKKDGYEVNNLCEEGKIELDDSYTNRDILNALKDFGFIKKEARMNQIDFENMGEMIEFTQRRDQKPLGRLELIDK